MNRWQAIAEIVKSFNDKDRPWHALAALITVAVAPVLIIALVYVAGSS
jgi:ABC-type glycerol-3-phosphate transport system permease component